VPIQNVSMVEETEDCSLFAIRLSPHAKTKGVDGSERDRLDDNGIYAQDWNVKEDVQSLQRRNGCGNNTIQEELGSAIVSGSTFHPRCHRRIEQSRTEQNRVLGIWLTCCSFHYYG
jgi:hypothetical protein